MPASSCTASSVQGSDGAGATTHAVDLSHVDMHVGGKATRLDLGLCAVRGTSLVIRHLRLSGHNSQHLTARRTAASAQLGSDSRLSKPAKPERLTPQTRAERLKMRGRPAASWPGTPHMSSRLGEGAQDPAWPCARCPATGHYCTEPLGPATGRMNDGRGVCKGDGYGRRSAQYQCRGWE